MSDRSAKSSDSVPVVPTPPLAVPAVAPPAPVSTADSSDDSSDDSSYVTTKQMCLLSPAHATLLLTSLSSSLVSTCHSTYARYSQLDAAHALALITSMPKCPALTSAETEMIAHHSVPPEDSWRRIKGTVAEPVAYFQSVGDEAAR